MGMLELLMQMRGHIQRFENDAALKICDNVIDLVSVEDEEQKAINDTPKKKKGKVTA
jgi:hypothetical protein